MDQDYDHHRHRHHNDEVLREILKELKKLNKGINRMSVELDNITAQVHANSDAIESAIVLINGIADRIEAAGVDRAALKALTDELRTKDESLSAAVVANTPASPTA